MFYTFKKGTEQIKETYDTFDVEKTLDKVVHLVLKRDLALNSTDLQYYDDFNHFFNAVNYERDVRCIVLTAKGKHFCAGLDLKETVATLMTFDESIDTARKALLLEEKIKYMQDAFTAIERCRFPVIAGVHGGVIGAGIDLITACDIVYSTKDAFFSVKEVDIGMVADLGTLQRLQIITSNWSLMKEYCLTGERFSPEEAVKLGIVSRVFESQDELHKHLKKISVLISQKSPIAVVGTKYTLNTHRNRLIEAGLADVRRTNMSQLFTDDTIEAVKASFAKSAPKFQKL